MANTLDTCGDGCGWIAGIIAAVAYGSFGVPVRHTKHIDVHPLVMQSFKTIAMCVFSWGVILLNVKPSWTWWGLVSGFLWVIGGTGGIYAIRMAGLAIAVGTWASVMVLMNFVWGILVFHEPIHDVGGTLVAFLLLTLGLVGMSVYAAPARQKEDAHPHSDSNNTNTNTLPPTPEEEEASMGDEALVHYRNMERSESNVENIASTKVLAFQWRGIALSQRQAGIVGAVFNGVMTGSSLIPLHYAKKHGFGGANFMLSMAGGSLISNILLWIIMYFYQCYHVVAVPQKGPSPLSETMSSLTTSEHSTLTYDTSQSVFRRAYDSMPKWHMRLLFVPGMTAGIMLSVAMFGSILAVTYLGQGVGNSIVQTKILVSGLWGIFLFREIRGCQVITKWFLSALLTVLGIVWLSHERILATKGQGGGH